MTRSLPPTGASLLQALDGLAQALQQLSASLGGSPLCGAPACGQAPPSAAGWQSAAWQELSVVELRALLRGTPIDRRSLPAPIEKLRRAELVEALQQLQALAPVDGLER